MSGGSQHQKCWCHSVPSDDRGSAPCLAVTLRCDDLTLMTEPPKDQWHLLPSHSVVLRARYAGEIPNSIFGNQ